MNIQLAFITTEKQEQQQQRFLHELIALKTAQIEDQHYRNFWGTPEKIQKRREEVAQKVQRFVERVDKAFPGILDLERCAYDSHN